LPGAEGKEKRRREIRGRLIRTVNREGGKRGRSAAPALLRGNRGKKEEEREEGKADDVVPQGCPPM